MLPAGVLVLGVAATTPAPAVPPLTPTGVVRQLIDAVRGFKEEGGTPLSAAERQHNQRVTRLANQTLGVREVCERALGKQWAVLSAAQRGDFVRLVRQLFAKVAYPKSSGFFGDLEIEFTGERINGERAVVQTVVRHPQEGLVAIDYQLKHRQSGWVINDILLDEVSLAVDLRSQIQKVLREESYARLLQRMRDKLKEG